jgi:hypothetical protein
MPNTDEESVNSFDAENKDRRRKEAYKLYKHYAKPTRDNMCRILDYAKDTDMTRQDVDLLPWNPEKTEVIKEAMKSPKKKQKTEQEDKKKDKKEKEFYGREDTAFTESKDSNKDPTLLKRQMGDSLTSLDIFRDVSIGSLDTSSSSWDKDHTEDQRGRAIQLRTGKVEDEEQNHKREERHRKRDEATKNIMPQVDVQETSTAKDTEGNTKEAELDRLERAFQWYTRMASPIRKDFKRRVADVKSIDITPEDVDLLPWNLTGRVVNIAKMNAIIRASILKQ